MTHSLHPEGCMPMVRGGESMEPPSDIASLTTRMARGEEAAYRVFYERYHGRLRRYLLVVTRNESAAVEALQQMLLRVVRHVRTFEDEAVFWSWLTVLARSAAADDGRKQRRYFAFLARFFHHAQTDLPLVEAGDAEARLSAELQQVLEELEPAERWLIEQKYFAGADVRTIAAAANTTEKAVESKLVRVRRKLKAALLEKLNHEKQR